MNVCVKPAKGLKVRSPETGGHLAAEGAEVPRTSYWLRRIQDGDVEVMKNKPKPAKPAVEG